MKFRNRFSVAVLALGITGPTPGPFDLLLFGTPSAPSVTATARLVYAESPFGLAVTVDGRSRYDVQLNVAGLPAPSSLGAYTTYVAWEVSTDLTKWARVGTVANGVSTIGSVDSNKFLFVVTAEANATPATHAGPTVLHGTSPSGMLQTFLSHPLFRGVY
jgi:hypothetical protein